MPGCPDSRGRLVLCNLKKCLLIPPTLPNHVQQELMETLLEALMSTTMEISPGCSLEGLMLKLKLQYFGHLMWRVDSLEKTLMLGEIGGRRRRGQQRMRWLDGITDSMGMTLSKLRELVIDRQAGVLRSRGHKESDMTERLNWTELRKVKVYLKALNFPWTLNYSECLFPHPITMPFSCSLCGLHFSIILLVHF